ncbi:MAG: hypothetical protein JW918_00900 [Anaerolineae bacterium]|nr:hypothetical protein [Anaerolineae bacterium]
MDNKKDARSLVELNRGLVGVTAPAGGRDVTLDYVPPHGVAPRIGYLVVSAFLMGRVPSRCDPPGRVKISVPTATIGVKA